MISKLMANVPSVFNRADFLAILLPGYLLIIDYLLLFQPKLLFTSTNSTLTFSSGTGSISVDLLSTAIFLVAGPVAGLVIRQTHRALIRSIGFLIPSKRATMREDDKKYFKSLLKAPDTAISQVQQKEAQYDFDVSSLLVLVGLNLLHLYMFGLQESLLITGLFIAAILLAIDACFAYQGYHEILKEFADIQSPPPAIK